MTKRRIDAHHHFWRLDRGDYDWLTEEEYSVIYRDFGPDDLAPLIAEAGIQETILVQAAETGAETRFMLDIAGTTDFVAGVVGWVDMAEPNAPDRLAELSQNRYLRGIRPLIADIPDVDWMLGPRLGPAYRTLSEMGLTFDAAVELKHLDNLMVLLGRYPDLKVVIDHCAFPFIAEGVLEGWAEKIAEIARSSSAFCKMSGLLTQAKPDWEDDDFRPYLDHTMECFGPDRVMWGSDWPVVNLAGDYKAWADLSDRYLSRLGEDELAQILAGTASRFYGV